MLLPVCCIDFLLTKLKSLLYFFAFTPTMIAVSGFGIYPLPLRSSFSPPRVSGYLPDADFEVTGRCAYSTSTHRSWSDASFPNACQTEQSGSGRCRLSGCQRQQGCRFLKTGGSAAEDFATPAFLSGSLPLRFPPFQNSNLSPALKSGDVGMEEF